MARKVKRKHGYKWRAQVELPRGPDGERRRRSKIFNTKGEAEDWEAKMRHEINQGGYVEPSKLTVGEYLDRWLEEYAKNNVAETTYARYEGDVRRHIKPELGDIPLQKLSPMHVQTFLNDQLENGNQRNGEDSSLSPATVRSYYNELQSALNTAVKWGLLKTNPLEAVQPPRQQRKEMDYYDTQQARRFLEYCEGEWLGPLLKVAVLTGLRMSELRGLRWKDVDLDEGTMQIRRVLTLTNNNDRVLKEPKSSSGRRSISIPPETVRILRRWRQTQNEQRMKVANEWSPWEEVNGELVFTSRVGTPVDPSNLRRAFKRVVQEADLPEIRFHDLRHTHATMMLSEKVSPKVVSERLGHSRVGITLDRYSHVIPTMDDEAARSVESKLLGRKSG